MSDVCRGVGNFWLFLMFLSISCFKLVFLKRARMGCILLNVFVDATVDAQYVAAFFIISFIFSRTWLHVTENRIESLFQVYNTLKVIIYLGS